MRSDHRPRVGADGEDKAPEGGQDENEWRAETVEAMPFACRALNIALLTMEPYVLCSSGRLHRMEVVSRMVG